jgi:hypothetical protein
LRQGDSILPLFILIYVVNGIFKLLTFSIFYIYYILRQLYMQTRIDDIDDEIEYINNKLRYGSSDVYELLQKRELLVSTKNNVYIGSNQAQVCGVVGACGASVVNPTVITGIVPVIAGGTGLTMIDLNGIIIGNGTNTPTIQTISGNIIDSNGNQEFSNKIINGACNTITATYLYSDNNIINVSGIPLVGKILTISNINGNFINATWQVNTGTTLNIIPVVQGGTGLSLIATNGILIGNGSSTPTVQTINGSIVGTTNIQELSNKVINGNCNSITNITATISGVLPVISGGTGLSSIALNGVLIGNGSSTPTVQTINGSIVGTINIQELSNKVINGNCNSITNIIATISGVLAVISGGTGLSSIATNGILIGNGSSTPTVQTINGSIVGTTNIQELSNKVINGNCNSITNIIATISGVLPVTSGGTGLSSIAANGILIGNGSSTPTVQTINGSIVGTTNIQELSNKVINGNCNSITNITATISGVLPVTSGGTGLSSIAANGILIGNGSSTPTVQTINGSIVGTTNIQELSNKVINGNCNSITNITATISGVLPVISGGTGLSSIATNGILIGNGSSTPTVQTINGSIVGTTNIQELSNKVINGNCNSITNITATISGVLPVTSGGTGLSSIATNGILIGNGSSTPTVQTLNGGIIDSASVQSLSNKTINGNCNTITNISLLSSVIGILPVVSGGTGLSSIALNGVLVGNNSSTPTIQTLNGGIIDSASVQSLSNKTIDGNCNTITNISLTSSVVGILPVVSGGTGLSSIALNGVLVGNNSSTPTVQTLNGGIIDSASVQSLSNKTIDGNCNTITNISLLSSVVGILPVISGGTGLSSITLNGVLVGNNSSTPTVQTLNGGIIDSASIQSLSNKTINGNCNTITNISLLSSVIGILPVVSGGTGLSSIILNGVLIGNNSSTPTIQTLNGGIIDSASVQSLSNKIIDGNCNTITNISLASSVVGILPVVSGGTGLSSITLNGVLVGNNSSTPTVQTLNGGIIDSASVQSLSNKTINGNCNTITNISLSSSVVGILPVVSGGTGLSSIALNGVLVGNNSSTPTVQTINGNIVDTNSIQSVANKTINGNCNTITNISLISSVIGILPVVSGGTGLSSIALNGVLIGNNSSTPTIQTLNGSIIDSASIQSLSNKTIDGNCNTITNISLLSSVVGILPVVSGGTGLSSIALNGVIVGNNSSTPTVQTINGNVVDTNSIQSMANKIIDGNCNTITNISLTSSVVGILPVVSGGTGLSSITLNGVLVGNNSSTPTIQTLNGGIIDSASVQSLSNKTINGNCNTITNISLISSVVGILPVMSGGTGLSSIALNGVLIGNNSSTPTIQTLNGSIIDSASVQSLSNKTIDGNCNTITNISLLSSVIGILPVMSGGTGLSSITLNGVLVGNNSSTPTIQTLNGGIIDSASVQSLSNKTIDGNCNTITNISLLSSVVGILPVVSGGTGLSSITLNGVLIGNNSSTLTVQTINGNVVDTNSIQSMANKIIDGNCNTITNISLTSSVIGILPVVSGGTGLSSISLNGVLIGNNSSTPTVQTLNGGIIDSASVQSLSNKTIDGNCNTITNISLTSSVIGILPVVSGGTGLSSITLNGVLIGNNSSTPTVQTLNGGIIDSASIQSLSNKIIDGNCNTITNISLLSSVVGILPVISGGTGLSSITLNGILIGNNSSTPTIQTLNGGVIDSASVQSLSNKIIDGNCNTLTNIPLSTSIGFGTNTLSNSTITIADPLIKNTSVITLSYNSNTAVSQSTQGVLYIGNIISATNFTVNSNKANDNNSFSYICIY